MHTFVSDDVDELGMSPSYKKYILQAVSRAKKKESQEDILPTPYSIPCPNPHKRSMLFHPNLNTTPHPPANPINTIRGP
jgi:hypothetical protein